METHRRFQKRVRADQDIDLALMEALQQRITFLAFDAARQQGDAYAKRLEQRRERLGMLGGKYLGRCQDSRLETVTGGLAGGNPRDDGLTGSDIALKQAVHRCRPFEVLQDIPRRFLLRRGQLEWQRGDKLFYHRLLERYRPAGQFCIGLLVQLCGE